MRPPRPTSPLFPVLLLSLLAITALGPGRVGAVRAASVSRPILTYGSRGAAVRQAQALLTRRGYPVPATGFYGPITLRQVRRYQAAHGIRTTGQVGPLTWAALLHEGRPILTFGSRGAAVRQAQALLSRRGYPVGATGFYGPVTLGQVRRYQAQHGIRTTGQVGPLTWGSLLRGARPVRRQGGTARPVLTYGSRSAAVRQAQGLLTRRGYPVPATGRYGPITLRQVRRYQAAHGIRTTGQVGPLTWAALLRGAPARARTVGAPAPALAGGGGVVYLTFDDGPTPAYTPQVLGLLARYGARATFFVVGRNAEAYPGLVRREGAAGHGVGNHTFTHASLRGFGGGRLDSEVLRTSAAIRRAGGGPVRCLRPPYGAIDAASARRVGGLGLRLVLWDVDSNDWRRPGAAVIAGRVLRQVRSGDVVLLHDGGGDRSQTVAALGQVLADLSARGFRFPALCRG